MKKIVELNFQTPLEFVAKYMHDDLAFDAVNFDGIAKMTIKKMIAKISKDDIDDLIEAFVKFAPEVGFQYCVVHSIFHEYEKCPFCQLGMRLDYKTI